jgi:hypothetical protein
MPVKPTGSETEQEFIGRCMSEEKDSFPDQAQRYAVCKSKWDTENMGGVDLAVEDTSELPEPKEGESQDKYLMRCIPTIYKEGGEYDQRTATAMCADRYQNSNTLLKKENMTKSPFQRNAEQFEAASLRLKAAQIEFEFAKEGVELAPKGEASFPWEDCIAKMMDEYGDEDTANKVCGMIKSKYGH